MNLTRHHWFFDFDGTLARTGEDIILAWKKAIADMGLSCPHFDEVFRIGPTLEKMVYELFGNATPELVSELTERFKPNYDESGFPNTVPYPSRMPAPRFTSSRTSAMRLRRRSSMCSAGRICSMACGALTASPA